MRLEKLLSCLCLMLAFSTPAMAWNKPANFLFTAKTNGNTVSVIDVSDNSLTGKIITDYPIADIAVSGFGDVAFASHAEAKKVTVIDLRQQRIKRVLNVSIKPRHLTFEQNSGLVMTDSIDGGMAMLDTQGRKEVFANSELPPSKDIIFGPTGTVAYYYSGRSGIVGAVAMHSGKSLWQSQVPKSQYSTPLVRSLDGLFTVVTIPETGEAHALMSGTGKHIGSLKLGKNLSRPYVTANGQYFLFSEAASNQVHVVAQRNFSKITSFTTDQPTHLITSGLFDIMAVAYGQQRLDAIDLLKFSSKAKHSLAIKGAASDVIVTSDSKHAYAAIPSANSIAHLNLRSGELSYIEGIEQPDIVTMGVSSAICH
jgi:DNA-binding beta-propeller fold protein YncE